MTFTASRTRHSGSAEADRDPSAAPPALQPGVPAPARPRRLDALGVSLAVLTAVVWGSNGVAGRYGVTGGIPPWTFATLRGLLAIGLLLAIVAARRAPFPGPRDSPAAWGWAGGLGLLQTTAPMGFLAWGVLRVDAGLAMVLMSTQPFLVALLLLLLRSDERLGPARLGALVLGFLGVVVVAYGKSLSTNTLAFDWTGVAALLGGSLAWAGSAILTRRVGRLWSDVFALTAAQMVCGTLVLALLAALELGATDARVAPSAQGLAAAAYAAVATTTLAFTLWFWLVRRYGAANISPFIFLMPVAGVLLGGLLLGEALTPTVFAGLALVAASLAIVSRPPAQAPA